MTPLTRRVAFLILALCRFAGNAEDVVFPDPIVRGAVWTSLGRSLPPGAITLADLETLRRLAIRSSEPVASIDLTGVEKAHNLQELIVYDVGIESIAIPNGLTNLESLALSNNKLTNLVLADDMAALQDLNAANNRLQQIAIPPNVTNLRSVDLDGNKFTSFTVPVNLTNVVYLTLGGNPITSFDYVAPLKALTSLGLTYTLITSLSLSDMPQLHSLTLANCPLLEDIRISSDTPRLLQLALQNTGITNTSQLSSLPPVDLLSVGGTKFVALEIPSNLQTLFGIMIQDPAEALDISTVTQWPALRSFSLFGGYPTSLEFLRGLTNLVDLELRNCGLTNLQLYPAQQSVQTLNLSQNELSETSFLHGLTNLFDLYLSGNRLASFTPDAHMPTLSALYLDGNLLTNIYLPYATYPNLTALYIDHNALLSLALPLNVLAFSADQTITNLALSRYTSESAFEAINQFDPLKTRIIVYPTDPQVSLTIDATLGLAHVSITGPPGDYIVQASEDLLTWLNPNVKDDLSIEWSSSTLRIQRASNLDSTAEFVSPYSANAEFVFRAILDSAGF